MCTVTYYPIANGCIMTSNRDESSARAAAESPAIVQVGDKSILFPRDTQAGGTWIVADNSGNMAILFNGAFEKHRHEPPYRKSRGLILLDMFSQLHPIDTYRSMLLEKIEPFSVLFYHSNSLYRLTWTGTEKVTEELDTMKPVLFSSAPLYTPENSLKRRTLFDNFVSAQEHRSADELFSFHATKNPDDPENGFVMQRSYGVLTKSITQTILDANNITMKHVDLLSGQSHVANLSLT